MLIPPGKQRQTSFPPQPPTVGAVMGSTIGSLFKRKPGSRYAWLVLPSRPLALAPPRHPLVAPLVWPPSNAPEADQPSSSDPAAVPVPIVRRPPLWTETADGSGALFFSSSVARVLLLRVHQPCGSHTGGVQSLPQRPVVYDSDGDEAGDELIIVNESGRISKRISASPELAARVSPKGGANVELPPSKRPSKKKKR